MLSDIVIAVKKKYFNASFELETECLMAESDELSAPYADVRA